MPEVFLTQSRELDKGCKGEPCMFEPQTTGPPVDYYSNSAATLKVPLGRPTIPSETYKALL